MNTENKPYWRSRATCLVFWVVWLNLWYWAGYWLLVLAEPTPPKMPPAQVVTKCKGLV